MERFKECLFNPAYLIGDNGTVKSTLIRTLARSPSGILKGLVKPDGYKIYWLDKKWYYAHRLVAMHFIKNKNDWKEINHIDGNKANNHYTNLEWSTRRLNLWHLRVVLGYKPPRGKNHWSYGREPSDATRKLMSEKKTGVNHPRFKGYYLFNGVKFASANELGKANGVSAKTIAKRCKINEDGYSFEPI